MSFKLKYIALLFMCFACFLTSTKAQLLTYKTITTEDGLLSKDVHTVIQDSKGYIWIGTKNGLCRWDSKSFEYFTIADGLPNNEVLFLYEDSKGRIWISTLGQELCYFFNGRIFNRKNTPFLNKISHSSGSGLTELHDELYYVSNNATFNKINLLTNKITVHDVDSIMLPGFTYLKYKDKVWGVESARRIDFLLKKKTKNLILSEDTCYYNPYYFFLNLDNTGIITSIDFKNKQYGFQNGMNALFYKANYSDPAFQGAVYNKGKILEVYENYILQKRDSFLLRVHYRTPDIPLLFSLNRFLFIPTTDGLSFCRQIPILEYSQNLEINNDVKFVFKFEGDVYAVNETYQLINVTKQKKVNQLKKNAINLYNLLHYGDRYYLTTSFNIYHFSDPNEPLECYIRNDIFNFKFISPSKKDNSFFVANGVRRNVFLIDFKKNTRDTLLNSVPKVVYSVYEDSKSRLWYTTANKVYYTYEYYRGIKDSREFVLNDSIPIFCKSMQEDHKGNIFFTTNSGIFVYDGKNKYRIDKTNLLGDNECNKIVIDTIHSNFWVATQNGLSQIGYAVEKGDLKFNMMNRFFASDGLRSNIINDLLLDGSKLYIGTDKGVNILDDVSYHTDTTHIPIYIRLQAVNSATNKTYDTLKTINLEHDQNNLTIGFSALYFLRRDRLKVKAYLYRNNSLVSRNEITEDKIDYYSLNDGSYKLILYAYDEDYRYNKGKSAPFIFTINPPYYKTWWFIIGSSLIVIIITTSLLLWRQNRKKKRAIQEAELQAQLNESTLKSLQSQMNPHFVFNSLNTIQSFITEKNEEGAIDYLSDFSVLMREILEQSVHTFISLENELHFLQQYIRLEITRYKGSFDAEWHIELDEDDLTDIYIPTMLIQPILENAVKHGVSTLNTTKGHIEIMITLVNEHLLQVVIKDNGNSSSSVKSSKGNSIAVKTIKDRLKIYTKNKIKGAYSLEVTEAGATATITIPI